MLAEIKTDLYQLLHDKEKNFTNYSVNHYCRTIDLLLDYNIVYKHNCNLATLYGARTFRGDSFNLFQKFYKDHHSDRTLPFAGNFQRSFYDTRNKYELV